MKVMIVHASRFGHTRALACALARVLRAYNLPVACAPARYIDVVDLIGFDTLVLATDTRGGRAAKSLRTLVMSIPAQRLQSMRLAIIGTQTLRGLDHDEPSGAHDLLKLLAERDIQLALSPLVFTLEGIAAYLPNHQLGPVEQRQIEKFADRLSEVRELMVGV